MRLHEKDIKMFQEKILSWYTKHKRDLPWRSTNDPYRILISEIMSQQTQILRVVPKYQSWLEVFPTIESLAYAPVTQVLTQWSGLGYNRRALNLQKAARVIVDTYHGNWPKTPEELEKLPGIGTYTASAIACFAFNAQIPVIDTNVRKVILVYFFFERMERVEEEGRRLRSGNKGLEQEIEEIAGQLLPVGQAKEWNQALMDYAGAVLKKEKIPLPKQSKFLGSNRWYRGDLLKRLTKQQVVTQQELATSWKKDYQNTDKEWFEKLLSSLEKEGFITRKGEQITLG